MHTTSGVILNRFAELKGQNVIPSILMIRVLKSEYWVEIDMFVL